MELHARDRLKIWVGGLAQETTKQSLDDYFRTFGECDSYVMSDSNTGRSRGFGFVNFMDENVMNTVLSMPHEIDGAVVRVDWKGNNPKLADQGKGGLGGRGTPPQPASLPGPVRGQGGDNLKIWIGGLAQATTKHSLDAYFKQFGFCDSIVMMDSNTGRSRGFGFVNFFDEAVFNTVLQIPHEIDGASVRIDIHGNSDRQAAGRGGGAPAVSYANNPYAHNPVHDLGSVHLAPEATVLASPEEAPPEKLKIWVGGLSQNTTKASLDAYFNQFGQADSIVMMDGATGRSRGFGFVDFFDELTYNAVLDIQHSIDGTPVRVDTHGKSQKQAAGPPGGGGNHSGVLAPAGGFGPRTLPLAAQATSGIRLPEAPMEGRGLDASKRDQMKIWVGGLAQHTTKQSLDAYFMQFGEANSYVMMDSATGRSRGFGFVNFFDEAVMNTVLSMEHEIDGARCRVDSKANNPSAPKPHLGIGSSPTSDLYAFPESQVALIGNMGLGAPREVLESQNRLKIWVGGLQQATTKHSLDAYFKQFGEADSIVMMDSATGRSRGFGFVNFTSEPTLNTVLSMQHVIDGAAVRVDRHGNSEKQIAGIAGSRNDLGLARFQSAPAPIAQLGGIEERKKMKIWIGGLSQSTTKQSLDAYFQKWGHADSIIMRDGATGRSRGFGFVNFSDEAIMNLMLTMDHEIDGVKVRVSAYGNHQKMPDAAGGGGVQAAQAQVAALQQQQQQLMALQQQSMAPTATADPLQAQAAATDRKSVV